MSRSRSRTRSAAQAADAQRRLAAVAPVAGRCILERLADDQAHELVVVEPADGRVGDHAAVAQDDDAIGEVHHLVEAVRDEDHARAAGGRAPHRGEQPPDLVAVQRGRRLVEDQQTVGAVPPVERARDRDDRPLGRRQLGDGHGDVERRVELAQQLTRVLGLVAPPGRERGPEAVAPPEIEVLDGRELRDQSEVLVDDVRRAAHVQRAPGSGSWTPARIFTSVDLPEPFWPTRATISPGGRRNRRH